MVSRSPHGRRATMREVGGCSSRHARIARLESADTLQMERGGLPVVVACPPVDQLAGDLPAVLDQRGFASDEEVGQRIS
ncbi:hypothetical protein QSJ19_18730 [Gordonia sp. ABSL11-1]|uniref:hypothetical protein n=1 Tax=Gordonia sp. ABSL11-1 TaxID=3053924 RepID=UPI0025742195|nr:hypothetical protein [Gordonia sp. ABSL11-1]MDL9947580.1 hypothetical protein [Gordonia sp. ABSL11-1]